MATLRIYLTGPLIIEVGGTLIRERDFPSRQARLAWTYLVAARRRPVPRDELAEIVWPGTPPRAWETALSALISNLRALLGRAGLPRDRVIANSFGCYQAFLPAATWIDLEAAVAAVDEAEGALRAGQPGRAYGWAGVAGAIARRPFLPGETADWIDIRRSELRGLLVRALDCFGDILSWNGEPVLAVQAAREALSLEPFRETGYQRLMRLQVAAGNRAEAIRTYLRCRELLREELGVDPTAETETVYLAILGLA